MPIFNNTYHKSSNLNIILTTQKKYRGRYEKSLHTRNITIILKIGSIISIFLNLSKLCSNLMISEQKMSFSPFFSKNMDSTGLPK